MRNLKPVTNTPPSSSNQSSNDPYAVLGVTANYPLAIIEIIWKAKLRVEHPDAGGSNEAVQWINAAMAEIRKRKNS